MIKKISTSIVLLISALAIIGITIGGYVTYKDYTINKAIEENELKSHTAFMKKLTTLEGLSIAPVPIGGFIGIKFDSPLVYPKGNTQILAYLVSPSGASIQLRPIVIPEAKAHTQSAVRDASIIFPTYDIAPILAAYGFDVYALEIYVLNGDKSAQLPLIAVNFQIGETSSNSAEEPPGTLI